MRKKSIVYVGPFSFPNGGAAARRILGIAQTLQRLDCNVIVGTGQSSIENEAYFEFEDISVHSLNERTAEKYPTLLKHLLYFGMGKKTINWLNSLEEKPSAIILYSGYSPYFIRLLPWCRKNNIPLIFDAVEWYDPPNLIKRILSPYYWNIELAMRFLSVKSKNIIVISRFLQSYYSAQGCTTIRIPPTLDVSSIASRLTDINDSSDCIVMGYTGTPGNKDLLDNVLSAILSIDSSGKEFKFNIAGITENQLLAYPALSKRGIKKTPPCFQCFGLVSQVEAMSIIRKSDFSVLLRPNKRYAKAGFPTKFVESLAVGTPVIANFTSDLSEYLKDNENGIVCADEKEESLKQGLLRAKKLNCTELLRMRKNARSSAEKYFDINVNKRGFQVFFDNLKTL